MTDASCRDFRDYTLAVLSWTCVVGLLALLKQTRVGRENPTRAQDSTSYRICLRRDTLGSRKHP